MEESQGCKEEPCLEIIHDRKNYLELRPFKSRVMKMNKITERAATAEASLEMCRDTSNDMPASKRSTLIEVESLLEVASERAEFYTSEVGAKMQE